MRVAFLGNAPWSVPTLAALTDSSHRVVLALTRAPRLGGRGNRPLRTPVAEAAERLGLPLREVETVKRGPGLETLRESAPDVLVVVAYGEIVPQEVLDVPARMPVNVHFSLLPELRGAAPVQRALMGGLEGTGVTTMRMDAGMDTGPILLQQPETIEAEDDAGSLGARLAAIGARLLVDTLDRLEAGTLRERPQDGTSATVAPKLRPEDRPIDWTSPARAILGQVRGLAPEPGATTTFRGRNLKVLRAAAPLPGAAAIPEAAPGSLLEVGAFEGLRVAAGDGPVDLLEVQADGGRRMPAAAFVRGARPEPGERLG
jgi:methionyl-tRNA formyltransferase